MKEVSFRDYLTTNTQLCGIRKLFILLAPKGNLHLWFLSSTISTDDSSTSITFSGIANFSWMNVWVCGSSFLSGSAGCPTRNIRRS